MTGAWRPAFACPECGQPCRSGNSDLACAVCGLAFDDRDGVLRFLPPGRAAAMEPFLRQYRDVRTSEGYRPANPDYYRRLPYVAPADPQASAWRVRRESYVHLLRHAVPSTGAGAMRIVDLGAGCGWLSHRLAALGHAVVAVDQLDDDRDGVGAWRHYASAFVAVQADFDRLPFAGGQFDLAVFEGALHYSPDPAATLAGVRRTLAPGGTIAVMDSPTFDRESDGEAMVRDLSARLTADHGLDDVIQPGAGFLTFDGMRAAFAALGLQATFYRSRGPVGWRVRRRVGGLRMGRAPAAFGVWVAR